MAKVRTTITIQENILDELRRIAFEQKTTLSELFTDGARDVITRRRNRPNKKIVLPTFEGGLREDISEEALLEMEQHPFIDQFHSLER